MTEPKKTKCLRGRLHSSCLKILLDQRNSNIKTIAKGEGKVPLITINDTRMKKIVIIVKHIDI